MPTLSICIPTYNRAALLTQALTAIAAQLTARTTREVDIVVSDNASPDETPARVAEFCAQHPAVQLSYIRQPQNLGADGNINFLLQHATGEFMLILSDDDILLPGAIDRVFEILAARPSLDAIGLNVRTFLNSPDEPAAPMRAGEQDRLIANRDDVLTTLDTWITFVSVLIFRRSAMSAQGYTHRIGTNFIHAYVMLDVLARDGGCWLTGQPFLAIRGNNTGGYNFFQAFVSDFAALLEHAVQLGYSPRATWRVLKEHEAFLLGFVIAFKVRGVYGTLRPDYRDGLTRIWRVYRADPIFLLKVTPLLLMPQFAVGAARRIRHLLKRRA